MDDEPTPLPNLAVPLPDMAHEALRQAFVKALADLADHITRVYDSLLLNQTAMDFAETVLTNFTALQGVVTDQAGQIAALTERVAALEATTLPLP